MGSRSLAARVAALAGGVILAGGAAAMPPAPAAATERNTTLTIVVAGCPDCSLFLVNPPDSTERDWESKSNRVRDGRVTFTVASHRTRGMAIDISSPTDRLEKNSRTLVVMRYAGMKAGSKVTAQQAAAAKRAAPFWAGTSEPAKTLRLQVDWFRVHDEVQDRTVRTMRPYMATSLRTTGWGMEGQFRETWRGTLGYQGFA